MKLIEFKEYNNVGEHTLNKKKVAVTITLFAIVAIILIFSLIYFCSPKFRNWADVNVLMKEVKEGELPSLDIDSNDNTSIIAYDKYIALLNNNQLDIYNASAKKVGNIDLSINNPIYESNGKYLVIAEKDKEEVHLISSTKKVWTNDTNGSISRINVNENGYVSVVCTSSTYKSIIIVYDQSGNELFKTYIPNNKVVDSVISGDNKYLSFAEIDTTGTLIKSTVKTISIKDAKTSSETAITNKYEMPTNSLVVNLKYQGSKNLVCMCDDGINILSDGKIQQVFNFKEQNSKYSFAGIDLINSVYEIEEHSDGISNQSSTIKIIDTGTKKTHQYLISSIAKDTLSTGDIIAINLGTEVYFINTKGMLKKKFISNEEIRDVLVSERIAAIIFRDHIEILVL